jgi:predicted metalloprotease
MHCIRSGRAHRVVLGALVSLLATSAPAVAHASPVPSLAPTRRTVPLDITDAQIAASNEKVSQAYQALVSMWSDRFARLGGRFAAPGLQAYRGAVRTSCGVMHADNAAYCTAPR